MGGWEVGEGSGVGVVGLGDGVVVDWGVFLVGGVGLVLILVAEGGRKGGGCGEVDGGGVGVGEWGRRARLGEWGGNEVFWVFGGPEVLVRGEVMCLVDSLGLWVRECCLEG